MAQGEIDENNQILGDEALAIYLQKIEEAKYAKQQQIYENNSNALMLQHHNYMSMSNLPYCLL